MMRHGISRQAAAEDRVERLVTAQQPLAHHKAFDGAYRKALRPSRSLMVDASCSESRGFSKKASAPASMASSRHSSTDTAITGTSSRSLKYRQRLNPEPPEMSSSITASEGGFCASDFLAVSSLSAISTSNPSVFRKYS